MKCLPSVRSQISPRNAASTAIAAIGLLFSTMPAWAVGPLTARAHPDAAVVQVVPVEQGWRLESAGQTMDLPLPPRSRVAHLVSSGSASEKSVGVNPANGKPMWQDWLLTAVHSSASGADQLHLLRSAADGSAAAVALPVPALAADAEILLQPRVLLGDDTLQGLIWLEGKAHNALAVRFASWNGTGWQSPTTVSPAGPGTQIALQTVALDDGGWLAAWAAFDGQDDEIAWSRFADGKWSQPATLSDNEVPDVTPALFATSEGALAAWSGFDGRDYRLHVSRFDGKQWSPAEVTGGRGVVIPEFSNLEAPVVVFRQVAPRGWAIAELTVEGRPKRMALTPSRLQERPIVRQVDDKGVLVEWLDSEFKSAQLEVPWQSAE